MKHRNRFLPIFLLSLALTAPAALPGTAPAEASMQDKDKAAQKDKADPQYFRQSDRNDDWDDWGDDWDDDDANMRFEGMDTNRDGRVTRREWRGNDRSFDNHDRNRDGVLSGTELRPGGQSSEGDIWGTWDTWNDVWNARFERLDRNNNGYVSTAEWTQDQVLFDRIDLNNDNRLSRSELINLARQRQISWDRQFTEWDVNRDGRLTLREWRKDRDAFERLDRNNDGYVIRTDPVNLADFNRDDDRDDDRSSRAEPYPRTEDRFRHFDRNRDRLLSLSEWTGSRDFFDQLDRNNNGYLSVQEWSGR